MRFYVRMGLKELGPFHPDELAELVRSGSLELTAQVRPEHGTGSITLQEALQSCTGVVGQGNADSKRSAPGFISTSRADGTLEEPVISSWSGAPRQNDARVGLARSSDGREGTNGRSGLSAPTSQEWAKWAGTLVIVGLAAYFFLRRGGWTFLDGVDLIFHEAGHLILGFFPDLIVALGGTIFQLAVPVFCTMYFLRTGRTFAARFGLVWTGQSLQNVSVYVADARSMILPLVGGGEHDWHYILGRLGWLQADRGIAGFLQGIAVLLFIAAVLWPWLESVFSRPETHDASEPVPSA